VRLVGTLFGAALLGGSAFAAPPPPAIYPPGLPQQADGYDLPPIYGVYHLWIDRGRRPALVKALPNEGEWQGKRFWGTVIESELVHYDFGTIRMDRLDRYCAGNSLDGEAAGTCDYRYRYAFVPGSLYGRERDTLIQDSFRPEMLTRLLAREGWTAPATRNPPSDETLKQIFERHTDLAAFYGPLVEFHEVRASSCAGLRTAIARLARIALQVAPEKLPAPGNDIPLHGQTTRARVTAATTTGERVVVEGTEPLFPLLEPIWKAVESCSRATSGAKQRSR
jgi:hypothetical protein